MQHAVAEIEVTEDWSLDDFLLVLRRYKQVYAFAYAISWFNLCMWEMLPNAKTGITPPAVSGGPTDATA